MKTPAFKRILLKLSGEVLSSADNSNPFDREAISYAIDEIIAVVESGVQIGIVLGGGNIFRGARNDHLGIHRTCADQVGMLATLQNALVLQGNLQKKNIACGLFNAFSVEGIAAKFNRQSALNEIQSKVLIFAGGTGNPYVSTDTAAVIKALEIEADILLKATKVDGAYDRNPIGNSTAKKFLSLTFQEAIERKLGIMDPSAFSLCMENSLNLMIFSFAKKGSLLRIIQGERLGTWMSKDVTIV